MQFEVALFRKLYKFNEQPKTSQDLPNEVLIQIFELVPRQTVYQCLSVCKAWERAALQ